MKLWVANMILCLILGFGSFFWALKVTMDSEAKKKVKKV